MAAHEQLGTISRPIDFAIVTALKVERDAVLSRLEAYRTVSKPGDPYVYYIGEIAIPGSSEPYRVVAVMLLDPGNIEAAVGASRLINQWQPENVLMVGIAGGIAQAGVSTGDVVIARFVHYYEPGKRTPAGEQRRAEQYFSDRILWGKALSYEAAEWKGEISITPPIVHAGFIPKAHFGPIASGELVIADENSLAGLLSESPKLLAVAMEGAGVAKAVANTGGGRFLEIRGISDLADRAKSDDWHVYAANAAAAFTFGFLRSKPVAPRSERAGVRAGQEVGSRAAVVILRAQSLRSIKPTEALSALPQELRGRDHSTVALDFTDLVDPARKLTGPGQAVRRLTDPQGLLLTALSRRDEAEFVFHGLVSIPLAFLTGYLVSDRQQVRLLDFQPATGSWAWPAGPEERFPPLKARGLPRRRSEAIGDVIVCISVSYQVLPSLTEPIVAETLAAISLTVPAPKRSIVHSEAQVREYGQVFRQVLDHVAQYLPGAQRVHVFYAGPVSLAFCLGQQVSLNIHPPVVVWNYSRGYDWGINLAAVATGDDGIVAAKGFVI